MAKRADFEGTISKRKKGGKVVGWKGAITVGLLPDGMADRRWVSGKTQDEVREKLRALQSEVHTGTLASTDNLTVAAYLDRWLDAKEREGIKPNTVRSYRDTARLNIKPYVGRIKLEKLRALDIEHLLSALRRAGKTPQSQRYALRVLKMALEQAVRWQMLPRNVADAIRPPKIERQEMKVWTPEQVAVFLAATESHRLHAAFYLALMTGMRRGEILGLQWRDIDWERSRLTVRGNLVEVRGEPEGRVLNGTPTVGRYELVLQTPKTARSRRTIVLSPGTLTKLREHRERQQAEKDTLGDDWHNPGPDGFVFATELGTPTDPRNFSRWYKELVKTAGVPVIRLHDMRHTAASLMAYKGIPVKTVSERLGHADVGFTLQIYTHLYDEQREEAAFDLADLFPKAEGVN